MRTAGLRAFVARRVAMAFDPETGEQVPLPPGAPVEDYEYGLLLGDEPPDLVDFSKVLPRILPFPDPLAARPFADDT